MNILRYVSIHDCVELRILIQDRVLKNVIFVHNAHIIHLYTLHIVSLYVGGCIFIKVGSSK